MAFKLHPEDLVGFEDDHCCSDSVALCAHTLLLIWTRSIQFGIWCRRGTAEYHRITVVTQPCTKLLVRNWLVHAAC